MFQHLLLPLDGSRLAESALPAAAHLAQTLKSWITIVHVIERDAPLEVHGERHLADPKEARSYLDKVAARCFPPDICVEWHVHHGLVTDVARSIVAHVGDLQSDLIVMSTHGRGGLRARLYGSIAQQVIALGSTPVLLIRPQSAGTTSGFSCQRLLVPLDGDPEHGRVLAVAIDLAKACGSDLHLLMVVRTFSTLGGEQAASARLLPGTTSALLDLTQEQAADYLRRQMQTVQNAGRPVTAQVCRGDPVTAIVDSAQDVAADLVVLGTHGKAGVHAFWPGSIASKVSGRYGGALLLVPLAKDPMLHSKL